MPDRMLPPVLKKKGDETIVWDAHDPPRALFHADMDVCAFHKDKMEYILDDIEDATN